MLHAPFVTVVAIFLFLIRRIASRVDFNNALYFKMEIN